MECPHLSDAAKVCTPAGVRKTKVYGKTKQTITSLPCHECGTTDSPWCCCLCGEIGCGRYVKGHMKTHFEQHSDHCVTLDCTNFGVYCYKCDEYVINDSDSNQIQQLREYFQCGNNPGYVETSDVENENRIITRKRNHASAEDLSQAKGKQKRRTVSHSKTVGLRNLGNTCFMNAVLQSLNNIQPFSGYIEKLPPITAAMAKAKSPQLQKKSKAGIKTRGDISQDKDFSLVEEFRKTIIELKESKTALSPSALFAVIWKVVPNFRGFQQQDAHEFMRYLLDRLHQELLLLLPQTTLSPRSHISGVKDSVVTSVFGGILQSEVHCLQCGMQSTKMDPFLDLSLDIPTGATFQNGEATKTCDIDDCLSSFTDVEELADTERYMCNNCKKRQRSTKKFWIRRLPNVLSLHLKRFRWSSFLRTKIETFVDFPIKGLDMRPYLLSSMTRTRDTAGSTLYDLAAVVVHHGSGAGSGHYTSYATQGNSWYHFNDSSVSACSEDTVSKSKAYILFYVRREFKLR